MSNFQKFKTNSYCGGGRHYSGPNIIYGFMLANVNMMLKGSCTKYEKNR